MVVDANLEDLLPEPTLPLEVLRKERHSMKDGSLATSFFLELRSVQKVSSPDMMTSLTAAVITICSTPQFHLQVDTLFPILSPVLWNVFVFALSGTMLIMHVNCLVQ